MSNLPAYIQYLLETSSSSDRRVRAELIQTHVSYVVLAGDTVYKWKKPVNFGFLDFSTLEKRKYFCEQEVCLNQRLCPETYLKVVPITKEGCQFKLDGEGEPVEFGVKMRRLPEGKMMSRVIAQNSLRESHLEQIIDRLVPFYASLPTFKPGCIYGTLKAVRKTVRDNFAETHRFEGGEALSVKRNERIKDYAEHFLRSEDVFAKRLHSGFVRECHGDLHSGNICLTDRVSIFDCIEFNESLRCTDIAADVAFLAMDLDFNNLHQLSDFFIRHFIERSGDVGLREVLNFYKCYRAYVRGKISLLTATDPDVNTDIATSSLQDAKHYFSLSEQYGTL